MRVENKKERHKEYLRKLIHIIFGTLILLLISITGSEKSMLVIGTILFFGIIFSVLIKRGHKFPVLNTIVSKVERENEKHLPGKAAILFFISAIILLFLFRETPLLVLAALSVQVFADSFAALVGRKYGKIKLLGKKSFEGSVTCLLVSILCISFFQPLQIAILAGTIATIVELLPIDDNLWVPLATGVTIKLLI